MRYEGKNVIDHLPPHQALTHYWRADELLMGYSQRKLFNQFGDAECCGYFKTLSKPIVWQVFLVCETKGSTRKGP